MTPSDFHARLNQLELITRETVANQAMLIRALNDMNTALRETAQLVASLVAMGDSVRPGADRASH